MTQGFVPVVRRAAGSGSCRRTSSSRRRPAYRRHRRTACCPACCRLSLSVATLGVMAAAFTSGSPVTRNPMFLAFPMMTLVSMAGHGGNRTWPPAGRGVDADRADYLGYLSRLRGTVTETAAAQRSSLNWSHPDPDALWTLIGGARMWERRASDPDFCVVRVGVGTQPLADPSGGPGDPIPGGIRIRSPLRPCVASFSTHSTIADAPITIGLRDVADRDDRRRFELGPRAAARDDLPAGRAARARPVADRRRDQRPERGPTGIG